MSGTAVETCGLGKRYRIGARAARPQTFREAVGLAVSAPLRNLRRLREAGDLNGSLPTVWALRDVSLQVQHGEVVGIIGPNGAGKSTLLKLLSRITLPTTGFADIYGRVGALLEVGTGFHPELTGRDNVYLSGSILGMDRPYIARRFDEIVEFAGIDTFLDTPVKRYSSGMYLRLAFAVAAHLEPDVLIVDEVLAVGDAEFQQKCIGRMDEVSRHGRTVLFVSHNLDAVQRLCPRSVLLVGGRVAAEGETVEVIRHYLAYATEEAPAAQWVDLAAEQRSGGGEAGLVAVRYANSDRAVASPPRCGEPLELAVRLRTAAGIGRGAIGFGVRDQYGRLLLSGSTRALGAQTSLPPGMSTWRIVIPSLPLQPGSYQVDLWVGDSVAVHDRAEPALRLTVFDRPTRGWGTAFNARLDGPVFCEYEIAPLESEIRDLPE